MTPVGCYHYSGPCVDFIRVDYGNEVYMYIVFIFSTNVSKLQAILDADARLIGGIAKFAHDSSFIGNLFHWLSIRQPIQVKVCSLMRNWPCSAVPQGLSYPSIFST